MFIKCLVFITTLHAKSLWRNWLLLASTTIHFVFVVCHVSATLGRNVPGIIMLCPRCSKTMLFQVRTSKLLQSRNQSGSEKQLLLLLPGLPKGQLSAAICAPFFHKFPMRQGAQSFHTWCVCHSPPALQLLKLMQPLSQLCAWHADTVWSHPKAMNWSILGL